MVAATAAAAGQRVVRQLGERGQEVGWQQLAGVSGKKERTMYRYRDRKVMVIAMGVGRVPEEKAAAAVRNGEEGLKPPGMPTCFVWPCPTSVMGNK